MRKSPRLNEETDSFDKIKADLDKRKKMVRRKKRKRTFKRILMIAVLILLGYGVYKFDSSASSRVNKIYVKGNNILNEEEIIKSANLAVNDRIYLRLPSSYKRKLEKNSLIKSANVKILYREQTVLINVIEEESIAYQRKPEPVIYFENLEQLELSPENEHATNTLPLITNVNDEAMSLKIVNNLKDVNQAARLSISEIIHINDKLEEESLKLVMNHGYYVFTSVETLPLLDNYATIISGTKPNYNCIYLLEYGPTEDTQVATAKPCEFD